MDPKIAAFTIDDLAAATFTPYTTTSEVDLSLVEGHAADLAAHGIRYVFINGTTGDSMTLSVPERKALAVAWVAAAKKTGQTVINHIGTAAISESMELAAHAQEIGCHAISSMPPYFFKPASARVLAEWLKKVGDAAPALPLYYYHFPVITGVTIDPHELLVEVEKAGSTTFRGMKFTEFNLWHYENCVRRVSPTGAKYDMCYGRDEAMLGGLAIGARASIGNGFNIAPGVYQRLRKAFFSGDMAAARVEQARANQVINFMFDARFGGNGLATGRIMYELKGVVKLGPPRTPVMPLTDAQVALLKTELEAIGFFSWCD